MCVFIGDSPQVSVVFRFAVSLVLYNVRAVVFSSEVPLSKEGIKQQRG